MKKIVFALAGVCAAVCCLGGCNQGDGGGESYGYSYESLDRMMRLSYSRIEVTVTDTFDENISLVSEYKVSYSEGSMTVTYAVEKLSAFDLDGDLPEFKRTVRGEARIENGVIVFVGGEETDIPAAVTAPGFTFKREYFAEAKLSGVYFIADVKDPSGFFGTELSCGDMKVKATFLEVFHDMRITYTSASGSAVEYKYVFTK